MANAENSNSVIIGSGAYDVADLHTYHKNARRGSVDEIAKSLTVNKQYVPITVNKGTHTGRPMEVARGNHTLMAARKLGWSTIDVNLIDVDDDAMRRIVLADNKTATFGDYDVDLLTSELQMLEDFEGTGYTDEDLDKLLNGLEDGEPVDSEHEETYSSRWELVVEATDEDHQRELYERFLSEGLTVRVLSL